MNEIVEVGFNIRLEETPATGSHWGSALCFGLEMMQENDGCVSKCGGDHF